MKKLRLINCIFITICLSLFAACSEKKEESILRRVNTYPPANYPVATPETAISASTVAPSNPEDPKATVKQNCFWVQNLKKAA